MMEATLKKINDHQAYEVQFRLGHKSLMRVMDEWIELDHEVLSLTEWEDLKDLCLSSSEKIQLETKGQIKGYYKSTAKFWSFSFVENKNSLRAYFKVLPEFDYLNQIQMPLMWNSLKLNSGLFLVSGMRGQGKSTLVKNIIFESQKNYSSLIGIYTKASSLAFLNDESVLFYEEDSLNYEVDHVLYDGVDTFVVDYNTIQNWEKWIKFAEEGRKVIITYSSSSLKNALEQIYTQASQKAGLFYRFTSVLQLVAYQKLIPQSEQALHEVLILNQKIKELIRTHDLNDVFSELNAEENKQIYQSFNQSILQSLIRRKIDVKTAFSLTQDPDHLDAQLKRMGL